MTSWWFVVRLVFLASAVASSGCLSSDTVIKVRADGSGTIEQSILVNPKTFEHFAGMMGQMAGAEGQPAGPMPSPKDMLDEAKLKEAAGRFGPGVRFVSAAPITQGDLQGARAVFAFDDINALSVSQGPGPGGRQHTESPVTFRLDKRADGAAVLTITLPEPSTDNSSALQQPSGPGQLPPEAMAMVKPLLQDLRVALAVDVDGALLKTNADHVSGSRVTLLDIAIGPLLDNPAAFEKLSGLGPGASIEQMKPLLKDLPGIKVNATPAVVIEFK
jgi:hypothetical protein